MNTYIHREVEHVRGLVVIRDAMRRRGASPLELAQCDRTIRQARERLAAAVRHAA